MELELCERHLTAQASAQDLAAAIAQRPRDPFWSLSLDDAGNSLYAEAAADGRDFALHCLHGDEDLVATEALDDRQLNAVFLSFLQRDERWRELCRWQPFEEEPEPVDVDEGAAVDATPEPPTLPIFWTLVLCVPLLVAGLVCWWLFPERIDHWLAPQLPEGARPHQALFFAIVAVLSLLHILAGHVQRGRRGWAKAFGKILVSKIVQGSHKSPSRSRIEYSYSVGTRQYRGNRLDPGMPTAGSAAAMRKITERYPGESTVAVYYRPDNPAEAVLETQARGINGTWVSVLLFGFLAWYFATP